MVWLIFTVLVFNALVGLVVCYEQARRQWHDRRLEQLRKDLGL